VAPGAKALNQQASSWELKGAFLPPIGQGNGLLKAAFWERWVSAGAGAETVNSVGLGAESQPSMDVHNMKSSLKPAARPGKLSSGSGPRPNGNSSRTKVSSPSANPGLAASFGDPKEAKSRTNMLKQQGLASRGNLMKNLAPTDSKSSTAAAADNSKLEGTTQEVINKAEQELARAKDKVRLKNALFIDAEAKHRPLPGHIKVAWGAPDPIKPVKDAETALDEAEAGFKQAKKNLAVAKAALTEIFEAEPPLEI
jgi:hypothetical protein